MDQPMIQPHLIDQYQRLAELENRPVEEVVNQVLEDEIDKRLWSVVDQRLSPEEDSRLHDLLDKGNAGTITDVEREELAALVAEVNRQMLERSKALALLQERGHDIKGYLGLRRDEQNP